MSFRGKLGIFFVLVVVVPMVSVAFVLLPARRRQRDGQGRRAPGEQPGGRASTSTRELRARARPRSPSRSSTTRGRRGAARPATTRALKARLRVAAHEHRRHAHRGRPAPRRRSPTPAAATPSSPPSAQLVDGDGRPQGTLAVSVATRRPFARRVARVTEPRRDRRVRATASSASTLRGVPLGDAPACAAASSTRRRATTARASYDAPGFDCAALARDGARAGVARRGRPAAEPRR